MGVPLKPTASAVATSNQTFNPDTMSHSQPTITTPIASNRARPTTNPTSAPNRPTTTGPQELRIAGDELGKLIRASVEAFQRCDRWEDFVVTQRGVTSDLSNNVHRLDHPASQLLAHLRQHGAPVPMSTKPWTPEQLDQAIARGPHTSAKLNNSFIREEFIDFISKGFWTVLPYSIVKDLPNLRLNPLGSVPQHDRRDRLIVDLSFYFTNQQCLPVAPSESMQFGRTLQRILQRILLSDPSFGPVYLSKIDISDGFYRIQLSARDVPKLAVLLPQAPGEEPMVAFPMVLPMGWVNSPPYFSAATETAADLMNRRLQRNHDEPPHRLEDIAIHPEPTSDPVPPIAAPTPITLTVPATTPHEPHYKRPMKYADIYVDDFIAAVQGSATTRRNAMRTLLHVLDSVFRPLSPSDNPNRQEPASVKKLRKGDGNWSTRKTVLGWVIDTVAQTITLPERRLDRLNAILADISPTQRRIRVKMWHKFLGELRSMVIGIPGARGLFSTLQHAFRTESKKRLKLTKNEHHFINDFRTLAATLPNRPTRIAELVPRTPSVVGTTDAAGAGMGGIAFIHTTHGVEAIVWRAPFDDEIRLRLVSFSNPTGDITNSDLELAATVTHHDVLATNFDLREHTIQSSHDNTPAEAWQHKGSTTTLGPAASLLRVQSHHQRHFRYVPLHDFLPGFLNRMSDDASRLWHLSDSELLAHFNTHYPQIESWRMLHVRPAMFSTVISGLVNKPCDVASLEELNNAQTPNGIFGSTTAPNFALTHCSHTVTPFHFSKISRRNIDDVKDPPVTPFELAQCQARSVRWARRWPAWGPRTAVKTRRGH